MLGQVSHLAEALNVSSIIAEAKESVIFDGRPSPFRV
jgi:hypothetical protein